MVLMNLHHLTGLGQPHPTGRCGHHPRAEKPALTCRYFLVGARGFEPLTSSVSRKRSPPELSARSDLRFYSPTLLHTALTADKIALG